MNGGQGGGFPPPAGGQWPGDGSGGPPYGGQNPHPDPNYGGQGSYGGGYGTQPQNAPYGGPYAPAPSYGVGGPGGGPPKKSRTGLIVGLAIGAAIVLVGGAIGVVALASGDGAKPTAASSSVSQGTSPPPATSPAADGGGRHSLTVPETVGPYHRMTGSVADRLSTTMRQSMSQSTNGKYADAYAKAKIAIYSKNSDPTHSLIFIGLSADDSPTIAQDLKTSTPSQEVDATFLGMGMTDTKDYPPGPLGGVLRCGTGPVGGSSAAGCAWADSSTVGALLAIRNRNATTLAMTTLDLRNAAER